MFFLGDSQLSDMSKCLITKTPIINKKLSGFIFDKGSNFM